MGIDNYLKVIKEGVFGRDVRQAIHDGIYRIHQAVDENKDLVDRVTLRQDEVEQLNNQMITEMTDKDVISAPEIIAARSGKTTLGQRLDEITTQLAQIAKPIVSFTFDDGLTEDSLTNSVFKEYGYPASFGLITDQLYNSNKNPVLNYKNYEKDGFEVLSHSSSHIYFDTDNTDPVNYHELTVSAEKLRTLGFSTNGFIVPYSTITANNLAYAKTIYDYILIGGTGLNSRSEFKKKTITRVSAFGSGVAGCKKLIDQAIANRQLLVFYDHGMGRTGSLTESEWREVLTYLKNKISDNLIEVHNVKNAISKFYGIKIPNLAKQLNDYNQLPSLNKSSWILENNTASAIKAIDTSYSNETLRVTVPLNAAVGTSVTLSNTVTLPASVEALGDRTKFVARIKMGNSQFTYFDKFIEVSYLDATGAVLLTESKQIYPNNMFCDNYFVDLYPKYPLLPKDITKIKVSIKFNVLTTPTVNHFIYISDAFLQFPNYREKTNVVELTSTNLTDGNTTPTVTGKEYFFVNNPVATSITNFVTTDSIQEITLFFGNANTTIKSASSIRLKDELDWTPAVGSVLTLYRNNGFSSAWWEKSRTER